MKAALRPQGLIDVVFVALTFAVGVQLLRLFITGMVFYLREVREFSTVSIGGIAFLVFGTAFLAPIAVRWLGPAGRCSPLLPSWGSRGWPSRA